ncbi:MAG: DUF1405 domain-containing protein [Candidatus ainarchaeum sp.]|nr:DUF1405 domain-containing protein [Candidatus ainarchaeum sp.]
MFSFIHNKFFLFALGLVNIVAGIYSLSFYASQLSSSPVWLWIFIADCPLTAILFGLIVILLSFGIKIRWLSFLSIVASVKFSLWTIFVLILSGSILPLWWVALVHLILLFEVIVFFELFDFRVRDVLLALIVFSIGDFFDYVLKTHPLMPKEVLLFAGVFAILSTIFLSITLPLIFSTRVKGNQVNVEKRIPFRREIKKKRWGN